MSKVDLKSICKISEDGKKLTMVGTQLKELPTKEMHKLFGSGLTELDLSFNELERIPDLYLFHHLTSLVLDNNMIEVLPVDDLKQLKELSTFTVNNNNLKELDNVLRVCENLPKLKYLSILKNPCVPNEFTGEMQEYQHHRYYMLYRLKQLKFLDSTPVTPEEKAVAKKKGHFFKVVKAKVDNVSEEQRNKQQQRIVKGQETKKNDNQTRSYLSFTKHVYKGVSSEGNRFISNNAL